MESFDFEKLAKDLIVEQLKAVDDPAAAAAQIVKKLAVSAVTGAGASQPPRASVSAACKGILSGILLLEKDLPAAAVAMLEQMGTVAAQTNQDPSECMTWAMEGMASVCRLASSAVQDGVQAAIEEKFMGAGEVFAGLLNSGGA